jgi:hypothetical protein
MDTGAIGPEETLRRLEPHWNQGMIAASIAISLLGAFTSTQLYATLVPQYFDSKKAELSDN